MDSKTYPLYVILRTPAGYCWQLFSAAQRLVAVSPDAYPTMKECRDSIDLMRRASGAAGVANIKVDPLAET